MSQDPTGSDFLLKTHASFSEGLQQILYNVYNAHAD